MQQHHIRVSPSAQNLPKQQQLAWKIAAMAADPVAVDDDVSAMVINRVIDNAAVAIAAINRRPVCNARAMALAHPHSVHPRSYGATLLGMPSAVRVSAEWAAWANGTAVRELDFHDTFLAADYSHPGDTIAPLLAVAQQTGRNGADLIRAIAAAYETQVNLVKGICLHKHKIDHIAHLGPAVAAGIGALLNLSTDIIYQSIQQALHTTVSTRQSRKGDISSWKAFAPAHAGKLAVEAVDRCMRGEAAPSPIYEGEDSVIAWVLDGPHAEYIVPLPATGQSKRAIMETYTKEHSAEYQSQALIDLAFRMRESINDIDAIEQIVIHTSHHTHYVIGSGANDPQKMDPKATRETLDHSIMYIFAVALQDGSWHHIDSYTPKRASRADTVTLWQKISTVEDPVWTERYHSQTPDIKAFGARVDIRFKNGDVLTDELAVANAHSLGRRPFARNDYIKKFTTLAENTVSHSEQQRFLECVQQLPQLSPDDLFALNVNADLIKLNNSEVDGRGIF